MSVEERLDLERQHYDQESTPTRYANRLKSACCRQCGREDGMQSTHRETLETLLRPELERLVPILHSMSGDSASLFYACYCCNQDRVIPDGYEPLSLAEVLAWLDNDTDPMAPDYAALAAEPEQVLASIDSRQSAGLEE